MAQVQLDVNLDKEAVWEGIPHFEAKVQLRGQSCPQIRPCALRPTSTELVFPKESSHNGGVCLGWHLKRNQKETNHCRGGMSNSFSAHS